MTSLSFEVDVGPQLTMLGQAGGLIAEGMERGLNEAANIGADWVDERLMGVLKTQTPYYRLQVSAHPRGVDWVIDDGGVVYGPWLETGRHRRPTRFRGYHTFRTVAQRMARESYVFVERHIALAVKALTR